MNKLKIIMIVLAVCCVALFGVTCVWAASIFNLQIGGRIEFKADGINCYVSQGRFLTSKQTDSNLQEDYEGIHKLADAENMFKPLDITVESLDYKNNFPSWTNLDMSFNENGDSAYLYFTITNRATLNTENLKENEFVKVEISRELSDDATKTKNAEIVVPTIDYIAPGETNHYFIEFKVVDVAGNALLEDFSISIMLDKHIDEVVLDTPEQEITRTWQSANVPSTTKERLRSFAYGDGKYVAVGISGAILHSSDGQNWTAVPKFTSNVFISCAYGEGVFVCTDSVGNIYKRDESTLEWQCVHTVENFVDGYVQCVRYINGMFVATCDEKVLTSQTGTIWTQVATLKKTINSIAYGNGTYVLVGNAGYIVTSADLKNWSEYTRSSIGDIMNVSFAGGKFFICYANGQIDYSTDTGETWTNATSNTTSSMAWIRDICSYSNNLYAVGYTTTGLGEIWISSNQGLTWQVAYTASNRLWKITVADRILYVVGDNGSIISYR